MLFLTLLLLSATQCFAQCNTSLCNGTLTTTFAITNTNTTTAFRVTNTTVIPVNTTAPLTTSTSTVAPSSAINYKPVFCGIVVFLLSVAVFQ